LIKIDQNIYLGEKQFHKVRFNHNLGKLSLLFKILSRVCLGNVLLERNKGDLQNKSFLFRYQREINRAYLTFLDQDAK